MLSSDIIEVDMIEMLSKMSELEDDILITSSFSWLMLLYLTSFLVTITSLGVHLFDLLLLKILFNLSFIECLLEEADFSDNLATDSSSFWMLGRDGKAVTFSSFAFYLSFRPSESSWTEQVFNRHHHLTLVEQPWWNPGWSVLWGPCWSSSWANNDDDTCQFLLKVFVVIQCFYFIVIYLLWDKNIKI